jgi:hypothetical protein
MVPDHAEGSLTIPPEVITRILRGMRGIRSYGFTALIPA